MTLTGGTSHPDASVRPSGRAWLLDLFKAVGCVLIVLHHLAFYGPMSDAVVQVLPGLMDWLFDKARLAVQLFLVCAGFLTAASLAKVQCLSLTNGMSLLWRRYLRLLMPLLGALSVVVLVSELIRPQFDHPSLSAPPTWGQAWAHVGLLQHVLGIEALSAGVWYVAMDLQLYATAVGVSAISYWLSGRTSVAVPWVWEQRIWLLLVAGSLGWWSAQPNLDNYALYFYGAYGLGWLAYQSREQRLSTSSRVLVLLMVGAAVWLDPRWRLFTGVAVAALLAGAPAAWLSAPLKASVWTRTVQWLSKISYSVFVVHFSVSLAVNAFVTQFWPGQWWPNGLGMLASLALSLCAGALVFTLLEQARNTLMRCLVGLACFMASVALAMNISSGAG